MASLFNNPRFKHDLEVFESKVNQLDPIIRERGLLLLSLMKTSAEELDIGSVTPEKQKLTFGSEIVLKRDSFQTNAKNLYAYLKTYFPDLDTELSR